MGKRHFARAKWWKGRKQTFSFATWNVRSLVESTGSVATASRRRHVVEDKKIERVVDILGRQKIDIAGLQETHWFGESTYRVADRLVLTSGRPVPAEAESCRRGEGVALVLNKTAEEAWRAGGCSVTNVNSRLMYARFRFALQNGGTQRLCVICAYAPTFRSSRSVKDRFYDDLQVAINSVRRDEEFVLLGDFNARIGSREDVHDEWTDVRGPHGLQGQLNSAGEDFLNFLSRNQATVSNTWFAKKDRLKHTWQHPRTKQWHCIDYIVTSQRARRRCRDAQVISTAECGSDHALLGMRFDLGFLKRRSRPSSSQRSKPFNVDRLRETRAETHPESVTVAESFQNHLRESLQDRPPEELSLSEKWSVLRECIVTSAEEKIGRCQRVQPDWYRDSSSILTPLLEQRNKSYADWVAHGRNNDHYYHQFKSARRVARRAVRRAQTSWFEEVAAGAESARFDGARMWKKIRILQRACRGLEPVKVNTIKDESGTVCATPAAQAERWNRHFERVLNIPSELNYSMLEALPQREVQDDLGDRPTLEEVRKAIGQLDNGKAAGASQIIAELMKAGGSVFTNALLVLLDSVWEEERVPQDWVDSVLVPIPKKGDLSSCDNWRGIALLDVVGKAVARLVQTRLQVLAEQVLPESQCGFRRQRSCTDMIFSVRQLQEKVIEHKTQGFFVFVDLTLWHCTERA